jgi:rhomboid protease GluP
MRFFLRRIMERPRLSDAELAPKPHAVLPERRPLKLTYGLLAALLAVFAAEYFFRVGAEGGLLNPSIDTLVALGALDKTLVSESNEWWRFFSAPLLHAGPLHIALNGLALFFAGAVLENVIGRAWFAAIFAVSGVCGAALSLAVNAGISVGASGAIMGLFAAAFAVSYRYPTASPMRSFLRSGSLRVLIPSVLPLFDSLFGQKVDYAAHIGGAAAGLVLGSLLTRIWGRHQLLPPYRNLAWGLSVAGLCGVLYGGVQIVESYAQYDDLASRLNSGQDPRSHAYRALALRNAGDRIGAEREWRAAFGGGKTLHLYFKPEFEDEIRANLAITLKENGKAGEAHDIARPVCGKKGEIGALLAKRGLCP